MKQEEIKEQIFEMLRKIAPESDPKLLKGDDDIRRTLDIDSFDFLNFIVDIDNVFGIETPEEDYSIISTLDSLVEYIIRRS